MMMDRKTMLIVVGCLLALIGAQKVINTIYPPKPKALRPPVAAVTNAPVPPAETAKPAEKRAEQSDFIESLSRRETDRKDGSWPRMLTRSTTVSHRWPL